MDKFEIDKIEQINPKSWWMKIKWNKKKRLAKKKKIKVAINKASGILEFNQKC